MLLSEYIKNNYESQADFARANKVVPQQVTKWIRNNWVIIDCVLYSPQRENIV